MSSAVRPLHSNARKASRVLGIVVLSLSFLVNLAANVDYGLAEPIYVGAKNTRLYGVADSHVDSDNPDSNYGSNVELVADFNSKSTYVYVMFDLSSIPSDAVIKSALLVLYLTYVSALGAIPLAVGAHRCEDTSWNEFSITWNNKPQFEEEPTYRSELGAWPLGLVSEGYQSWSVTQDLQATLVSGKLTEVLRWEPTKGGGAYRGGTVRFFSREKVTRTPYLDVEYASPPFHRVIIGSVQDTGETSNLGSVTIEGEGIFLLPIEVLAMPGSYKVTYNGGYDFLRWDHGGTIGVSDLDARQTTIAISGNSVLTAVGSLHGKIEYAYEYGPQGSGKESRGGDVLAVRFTPLLPGQLETARFFLKEVVFGGAKPSKNTVTIYVMDFARNHIVPPFDVTFPTPLNDQWFDVDLSTYSIGVSPGVDFYIGLGWVVDYWPCIGTGYAGELGVTRSWNIHHGEWSLGPEHWETYMIRAVVRLSPITQIRIEPQPFTVTLGESIFVSGSVSPPLTGVSLTLTYARPDGTTLKRNVTTTSGGSFNDTYSPDKAGNWTVSVNTYKTGSSPVSFTVKEKTVAIAISRPESSLYGVIAALGVICVLSIIVLARRRKRIATVRHRTTRLVLLGGRGRGPFVRIFSGGAHH